MAIAHSPAPRPPSRGKIVAIVLGVGLLLGIGLVVVLVPRFLRPMAEEEVVKRLRQRLDTEVEIESIDLRWGEVEMQGLQIGGADDPTIVLDRVLVELDKDALWDLRAVARVVTVTGGQVRGERSALEQFARKIIARRQPDEPQGAGRVRMVPERLEVEGVWVAVTQDAGGDRARRIEARLDVTAEIRPRSATINAKDLVIDPGEGPVVTAASIRTDVVGLRTDDGISLQFPVILELNGVGAPITPQIAIAGMDGTVRIVDADVSEVAVDVTGSFGGAGDEADGEKLWSAAGRVRRDLSEGELRLDMEAFELGRVPSVLARLPLVGSEQATVGGHIAVMFGDGVARVEGDVALEGLNVDRALLARTVVRDIGFELSFAIEVDPAQRRAAIHYADIERRGVKLSVSADVEHPAIRAGRRYALRARMPPTPCQTVLDAIPDELIPSLTEFRLDGEMGADVEILVDFADLDNLVLEGDIGIAGCKVRSTPPHASAERLASGFTHRVMMRDGRTATVQLYGGSTGFTSIRQVSPHMIAALQSTEDGGFWRHNGFMPSQFKVALVRNLKAGQVRLGASTITMQMVKNVLLSQERTLARKLQEMVLTWYVETVLTKDRIMELYLNAIEYGPGIYGITAASKHYFGKHPGDLTPPEAVYLALMLPSPVRRHAQYCRGSLTPAFAVKVQRILGVMNARGRLSDLEFELWKDAPVEFDLRRRGAESSCYANIKRLQDGNVTQRALSGLLGGDEFFDDVPPDSVADDGGDPNDVDRTAGGTDGDVVEGDAPGRPAMEEFEPSRGGNDG